jgi:hypothetical protein
MNSNYSTDTCWTDTWWSDTYCWPYNFFSISVGKLCVGELLYMLLPLCGKLLYKLNWYMVLPIYYCRWLLVLLLLVLLRLQVPHLRGIQMTWLGNVDECIEKIGINIQLLSCSSLLACWNLWSYCCVCLLKFVILLLCFPMVFSRCC